MGFGVGQEIYFKVTDRRIDGTETTQYLIGKVLADGTATIVSTANMAAGVAEIAAGEVGGFTLAPEAGTLSKVVSADGVVRLVTAGVIQKNSIANGVEDLNKLNASINNEGPSEAEITVSDDALSHSSVGDFTYNPKSGEISKMKGGGHGQTNIEFLEKNGIEYNVEKTYPNGVRVGNVPDHKTTAKRTGTNQAWFPESWSDTQIKEAGEYVANLPHNKNTADGVAVFGEYNGVRVGVIKTNGKIGTIFPDATTQP